MFFADKRMLCPRIFLGLCRVFDTEMSKGGNKYDSIFLHLLTNSCISISVFACILFRGSSGFEIKISAGERREIYCRTGSWSLALLYNALHSQQCTVYTVNCTLYTVNCTQCTVYTVNCTQCTLYTVSCTLYRAQFYHCSLYSIQLHTAFYTISLCTVNRIVLLRSIVQFTV